MDENKLNKEDELETKTPEPETEAEAETEAETEAEAEAEVSEQQGKKETKVLSFLYEWVEIICSAVAIMLVVFMFVFRIVEVEGNSMNKTLQNGDRLIISNAFYTPAAGDVVVITTSSGRYSQTPLIKRVIATEGQTVELDTVNWKVYITEPDGSRHVLDEEKYDSLINRLGENMKSGTIEYPYTVPEGCVFVMGDNRNHSDDSRNLGAIDVDNIVGRVIFRIIPIDKIGGINE